MAFGIEPLNGAMAAGEPHGLRRARRRSVDRKPDRLAGAGVDIMGGGLVHLGPSAACTT
jgi:hypothetical protein